MPEKSCTINEDTFRKYLRAQFDGTYNLFTEAYMISAIYDISLEDIFEVINHYEDLKTKYSTAWEEEDKAAFERFRAQFNK